MKANASSKPMSPPNGPPTALPNGPVYPVARRHEFTLLFSTVGIRTRRTLSGHAHDSACCSAARSESCRPSDRQVAVLVVAFEIVVCEGSLAEDVVFLDQDARVDRQPVCGDEGTSAAGTGDERAMTARELTGENNEESVERILETVVTGFSEDNVCPDIAMYTCQHDQRGNAPREGRHETNR